ncbi:MAG: cytidine deaminase [Lachnospiraceae bacterium]|jgi:cytidine deaminase|nr:cytidine deaminase [Lachnospiraceae bacterium]
MTDQELLFAAIQAGRKAYAPYSHYKVGCSLLAQDGTVFVGCNVENASYGAAICAERNALAAAIAAGKRQFQTIAIAGVREGEQESVPAYPCGICRQVIREFATPGLRILIAKGSFSDESPYVYEEYTVEELLPHSFTLSNGE